jgi:hypothetical protein
MQQQSYPPGPVQTMPMSALPSSQGSPGGDAAVQPVAVWMAPSAVCTCVRLPPAGALPRAGYSALALRSTSLILLALKGMRTLHKICLLQLSTLLCRPHTSQQQQPPSHARCACRAIAGSPEARGGPPRTEWLGGACSACDPSGQALSSSGRCACCLAPCPSAPRLSLDGPSHCSDCSTSHS